MRGRAFFATLLYGPSLINVGTIDQNAFKEQHFFIPEGDRLLLKTKAGLHVNFRSVHFMNFKRIVGRSLGKLS